MKNTIVHHEGAASLKVAVNKIKLSGSIIKIGLDVHARLYVAVAQYDQLLPKPARRLAPRSLCPGWKELLRAGHTVHVVYEACGFGFGLYRELKAAGAHCYVIAPRKLDEAMHGSKDRSARCHYAVPASVALRGGQHAGAGCDPGAERSGGTGPPCLTATRTAGPSSTEAGSPGAQLAD